MKDELMDKPPLKKRILVIDDEYDFTFFLKLHLQRYEYDAFLAYDGQEGIDKAVQERPDLILLDLFMPQKDGFQMLRELRMNNMTKNIPVVIMSAWTSPNLISIAQQFGVTEYVSKPCEIKRILESIHKVLYPA